VTRPERSERGAGKNPLRVSDQLNEVSLGLAARRCCVVRGMPIPFDKLVPVRLAGRTLLMKGTFKVKNCWVAHCAAMRLSIWRISKGNVEETF